MGKKLWILTVAAALLSGAAAYAAGPDKSPQVPMETYEIDFGPQMEAIPGEPEFLIPIMISVTQPTIGVNLLMTYDPTLLQPYVVAPNMFFQRFNVDLGFPGRIYINLLTDLPPPPDVPPLFGDTTFAWIQCSVTSDDLGYDLLTHISFYEDPNTPYPDNSILLEDGGWILPPNLTLDPADVLIIHPLYGDINLNEYPFEIGDAIVFLNYFMELTEFNRRQYANSDCNRDGIQASIADLVYLLAVVSGDTVLMRPPSEFMENMLAIRQSSLENYSPKTVDTSRRIDIVLEEDASVGGAYFVLQFEESGMVPVSVICGNGAADMDVTWKASGGMLRIAMFDWSGEGCEMRSDDTLFTVCCSGAACYGNGAFEITRSEFSDNSGRTAEYEYRLATSLTDNQPSEPGVTSISLSCYPNPSNSSVTVAYAIPADGDYDLVIYDILGREVRSLGDGFFEAGQGRVTWDGTDRFRNPVATGIYFVRLQGFESSASTKVFMLK